MKRLLNKIKKHYILGGNLRKLQEKVTTRHEVQKEEQKLSSPT